MKFLPLLLKDGYKVGHRFQYPAGTGLVYSNLTPRKSRNAEIDEIVFFGLQYFIKEYLQQQFREGFFDQPKEKALAAYKRRMDYYLGPDSIALDHLEALHDLGYLPLEIKALPEGCLVPMRVPVFTIRNTKPAFFWLTNMLETLMSAVLWKPSTSATTAFQYLKRFHEYAAATVGEDDSFIGWQGHDFSFRGMSGMEDAVLSGAAHLLCFTGTDTIPAIDFLELYYNANCEASLIGGSVPATEHSVMCMGTQQDEVATFRRLINEIYPGGVVSIVSDTWDFWQVITVFLPQLKAEILRRNGKVVIRPDSGDPVKIIVGDENAPVGSPEYKGAIECMWELFGGTITPKGFKLLDAHIGLIYGDSITLERQEAILSGLMKKGFASYNVVLGIGSFTYEYVTRDSFGFAMKATYGEVDGEGRAIFKDPKTDDGTKKSAKGLLQVYRDASSGKLAVKDECSWEEEAQGELQTVFRNGTLVKEWSLEEIRQRIKQELSTALKQTKADENRSIAR
ncbi:nicotinate phosphoribosyltransferase [Flavihumibacter sp. CACIAM 22H1]|uniref:nicotinate phosphoribosyltransferase n=1 Tax=Flavihumibacter sp. CACIAM 22H1 TaxID=1812911 RepID=UPI0007A81C40|nr:nicotinate phosphoribosyltransferase [Flavihumibacter sp. CACIAM 22H1]KYP16183.1 MAG: nicotinate phosphoribosyltransferase [Flavihumibacter sp. CACIAM 22H1]